MPNDNFSNTLRRLNKSSNKSKSKINLLIHKLNAKFYHNVIIDIVVVFKLYDFIQLPIFFIMKIVNI